MANDSEETQSTSSHDFASTKAAIFDTFNKLKKWREEQVQQFRNLHYLESQKLIQLSGGSQKQFEKLLENASVNSDTEDRPKNLIPESFNPSLSLKNDFENHNTLHESSITGHLERCFDDSSRSSLSLNENKVNHVGDKLPVFKETQKAFISQNGVDERGDYQQVKNADNSSSTKPKRPFLKKGTGLQRYMPKTSPSGLPRKNKELCTKKAPLKKCARLPQKTLQLKPAIRKTDIPSENVRHIRFDIPVTTTGEENINCLTEKSLPSRSVENAIHDDAEDIYSTFSSSSVEHIPHASSNLENITHSECESLNLSKENRELEEFEMLENCAQNSSFNSESSVVQRILQGGVNESVPIAQKDPMKPTFSSNVNSNFNDIYKSSSGSSIFSAKVGLSKCLEEAHARKEILQKVISDINPRIQSLQREISRSQQGALEDSDVSERCSTPIEDLNVGDKVPTKSPENDSDVVSSDFHVSPPTAFPQKSDYNFEEIRQSHFKSYHIDDDPEDLYTKNDYLEEENSLSENSEADESKQVLDGKSLIRSKLQELEKEIQIYQDLSAKLSSSCIERNEFLRKLQKEREDFNKYKEAEKKKLQAEIEEERRQIKRQKETFTRYQKLRRDNPTRKEREELNSLRQEIEKLQEEVKRQKIKYTSDSRRWKNQLESAERERDSFKLENIRLEEQCQDLLTALKTRLKKKSNEKQTDKPDDDILLHNPVKKLSITKNVECQTEIQDIKNEIISKTPKQISPKTIAVKKTKAKVRFNLSAEHQKNDLETVIEGEENETEIIENQAIDEDLPPRENMATGDQNKEENKGKCAEVNLSTISVSAESEFKEIDHGNKIERLYVSGERELIFHSGTRKIITADGKIKFLFYNGDMKEIFPDKREVYRYVNGTTETHFPDGLEVTEFPNGQTQKRYPDGKKEISFTDGTVHHMFADGSEEIRSADGNVVTLCADGTKTIEFANGQKEIRTSTYKRREFPDGAVKIIYDSGRQETRYPNGRIRIKDKEGKVLFDTKYLELTKD